MKQTKVLLICAAAHLAAGAQSQTAQSQTAQAPAEIPALVEKVRIETQTTKEIKIRNVVPAIIAHWLDAKQFPKSFLEQRSLASWLTIGYNEEDAPPFKPPVPAALPAAVRIVQVADEKNSLAIAGATTDVQQAEALIKQLDVPLKQVEIECQLVRVDNALLKAARLPFVPVGKTLAGGVLQQAKPERAWQGILNRWGHNPKTRILTAPRVVAIVGTAASIRSEAITTGKFSIEDGSLSKDGSRSMMHFSPGNMSVEGLPRFISSVGMTVVPQAVQENRGKPRTAQIRVQLSRNLLLSFAHWPIGSHAEKAELETRRKNGTLSTEDTKKILTMMGESIEKDRHFLRAADGFDQIITLEDGETMAFTGFAEEGFFGKPASAEETRKRRDTSLVAFVTLRIIHRLDQVATVPGT